MKDLGDKVIESCDCQWKKLKSSDAKVKTLLQNFNFLKPIYGVIEPNLLSTIQNDKIFEMVLCDVKTPQHLKPYFTEFCPSFKNIKVGRENFGNFVDKFADQKWKFYIT